MAENVDACIERAYRVFVPKNELVWKQESTRKKTGFVVAAVMLNIVRFPVRILMNVLVIMAVKTRPRLRSNYNILLACLGGNRPVSRSCLTAKCHRGTDSCHKRFIYN